MATIKLQVFRNCLLTIYHCFCFLVSDLEGYYYSMQEEQPVQNLTGNYSFQAW